MASAFTSVRDHYEAGIADQIDLLARVNGMVDRMEPPLTAEKFASFDQFHVGGLSATAELATRAGVTANMRVLDAGSGLGGPSRYLAEAVGCEVTGVDLAPSYVAIASLLAERTGLSRRVKYQTGSITDLPFEDASFDLVWTQHVVMNIADRDALYRELRRVLKPGGAFAFYDPFAPDGGQAPYYPVPWAVNSDTSTLLTREATITSLQGAGFRVDAFEDVTELGIAWIGRQQQQMQQAPSQPIALSPGMVVGERMREMVGNFGRNLMEGRVRLVMGQCLAV